MAIVIVARTLLRGKRGRTASVQVVGIKIDRYGIDIDPGPTETRPTARRRGRKPLLAGRPRPFLNIPTRQSWLPFHRE